MVRANEKETEGESGEQASKQEGVDGHESQ